MRVASPLLRPVPLAILGAGAIALGSFAPAADLTLYGEVSYWDVAGPEATIMLAAALATVYCILRRKPWYSRLGVILVWLSLLWPYVQGLLEPEPDGFLERTLSSAVDTTTGWASDIALNFVDMSWGMVVLLLGCVAITVGAYQRRY